MVDKTIKHSHAGFKVGHRKRSQTKKTTMEVSLTSSRKGLYGEAYLFCRKTIIFLIIIHYKILLATSACSPE